MKVHAFVHRTLASGQKKLSTLFVRNIVVLLMSAFSSTNVIFSTGAAISMIPSPVGNEWWILSMQRNMDTAKQLPAN